MIFQNEKRGEELRKLKSKATALRKELEQIKKNKGKDEMSGQEDEEEGDEKDSKAASEESDSIDLMEVVVKDKDQEMKLP